jgi:hypothetical protein
VQRAKPRDSGPAALEEELFFERGVGKSLVVGSYDQHLFLQCGNAPVILAVGPRNPKARRIDTTVAGGAAGRLAYICSECVHARMSRISDLTQRTIDTSIRIM